MNLKLKQWQADRQLEEGGLRDGLRREMVNIKYGQDVCCCSAQTTVIKQGSVLLELLYCPSLASPFRISRPAFPRRGQRNEIRKQFRMS